MFQNSIDRSRIGGLLQMMRESSRFVNRLGPADLGAVVVFDSRLRVWQDFTSDRARLSEVLGRNVLFERPDDRPSDGISLLAPLDREAAERAASIEAALLVLARALGKIEGAKSLVLFGYGFGRFMWTGSPTGVALLDREYEEARAALIAARVTVFAMDITNADTHTMETGLMTSAEDTGGFYERLNTNQSAFAMDRLEGALDGYYLVAVERPAPRAGRHSIRVRANAPRANVSARRYYID